MSVRTPSPTPTGPVGADTDAGAFFTGIAFIGACFLIWPALTLFYDVIVVLAVGGMVGPVLPSAASLIELVGFGLLAGLISGLIRLRLRNNSRYLANLVEAVLGAASVGQITVAAVLLNLVIGAGIGVALGVMGVSSPFDVLLQAEALFSGGGAIALVLGGAGGGAPPQWWDILLMLFLLLKLLGILIGMLAALLLAWIGSALGADAGRGGSNVGAAIVLSLTRFWRAEPNPAWRPKRPLPREVADLMSELTLFEREAWRREPRRDLLENYRAWLDERGHAFTLANFIEFLPEHRDWLRIHGTTQGQRYLGAFADRMEGLIEVRRREIEWRASQEPVPKLIYSDNAPEMLEPGDPLTYPGWISSAIWIGFVAGSGVAVLLFLVLGGMLVVSWF